MTVDFQLFIRRARNPWWLVLLGLVCFGSTASRVWATQSVELSWHPSATGDVVAYNVYVGTQSGDYTICLDGADFLEVTNNGLEVCDAVIPGLEEGTTYYFEVTSVDAAGNESERSDEAVYAVPGPPPLQLQLQVQAATTALEAVQASWTPSSESGVYGYAVYYGTQSGDYTNSAWFYDATNGLISGLTGGATYYFAVAPVDDYGVEAIASSEVSGVAPTSAPMVLEAQAPVDSSGVELVWNAIPNAGVVSYNVYYGTQSGQYTDSVSFGSLTEVVVHGLTSGQSYYFAVTAVDAYGDESPYSSEAVGVAAAPLPLVLQVQPTNGALGAVAASWTLSADSDVYGYEVCYWTQSGETNSAWFYSATNGLISGLTGGATYYFAVAPVDDYGAEAIASSAVSCVAPTPQPMVLQARTPVGTSGVELNWNAVTNEGAVSYDVYYWTDGADYTNEYGNFSETNVLVQGLQAGQSYYFAVTSVDAYGNESPVSNAAAAAAPLVVQMQSVTDHNRSLQRLEIHTSSVVSGAWGVESSSDLKHWTPLPNGYGIGNGNGDGYDVDVYCSVDPTAPQMFFRVVQATVAATVAAALPAPIVLQSQTYTDGNGQPHLVITTASTVSGSWEMDASTDLQNWTYYTSAEDGDSGDTRDVEVDMPVDPTQPQMFFRLVQ